MKEPAKRVCIEPRWPIALAMLVVLFLLVVLPGRFRLFPAWSLYLAGVVVLAPMAAVGLSAAKTRWLSIERILTLLFVAVVAAGTLTALAYLIVAMIRGSTEMHGLVLLTSSVAVWVSNVLMFSLLYWQIDRGGPCARASGVCPRPTGSFRRKGRPLQTCCLAGVQRSWTICFSHFRQRRRLALPTSCR